MLSTNADALTAGLTLPSPQSPTKNEVHDFSNALETPPSEHQPSGDTLHGVMEEMSLTVPIQITFKEFQKTIIKATEKYTAYISNTEIAKNIEEAFKSTTGNKFTHKEDYSIYQLPYNIIITLAQQSTEDALLFFLENFHEICNIPNETDAIFINCFADLMIQIEENSELDKTCRFLSHFPPQYEHIIPQIVAIYYSQYIKQYPATPHESPHSYRQKSVEESDMPLRSQKKSNTPPKKLSELLHSLKDKMCSAVPTLSQDFFQNPTMKTILENLPDESLGTLANVLNTYILSECYPQHTKSAIEAMIPRIMGEKIAKQLESLQKQIDHKERLEALVKHTENNGLTLLNFYNIIQTILQKKYIASRNHNRKHHQTYSILNHTLRDLLLNASPKEVIFFLRNYKDFFDISDVAFEELSPELCTDCLNLAIKHHFPRFKLYEMMKTLCTKQNAIYAAEAITFWNKSQKNSESNIDILMVKNIVTCLKKAIPDNIYLQKKQSVEKGLTNPYSIFIWENIGTLQKDALHEPDISKGNQLCKHVFLQCLQNFIEQNNIDSAIFLLENHKLFFKSKYCIYPPHLFEKLNDDTVQSDSKSLFDFLKKTLKPVLISSESSENIFSILDNMCSSTEELNTEQIQELISEKTEESICNFPDNDTSHNILKECFQACLKPFLLNEIQNFDSQKKQLYARLITSAISAEEPYDEKRLQNLQLLIENTINFGQSHQKLDLQNWLKHYAVRGILIEIITKIISTCCRNEEKYSGDQIKEQIETIVENSIEGIRENESCFQTICNNCFRYFDAFKAKNPEENTNTHRPLCIAKWLNSVHNKELLPVQTERLAEVIEKIDDFAKKNDMTHLLYWNILFTQESVLEDVLIDHTIALQNLISDNLTDFIENLCIHFLENNLSHMVLDLFQHAKHLFHGDGQIDVHRCMTNVLKNLPLFDDEPLGAASSDSQEHCRFDINELIIVSAELASEKLPIQRSIYAEIIINACCMSSRVFSKYFSHSLCRLLSEDTLFTKKGQFITDSLQEYPISKETKIPAFLHTLQNGNADDKLAAYVFATFLYNNPSFLITCATISDTTALVKTCKKINIKLHSCTIDISETLFSSCKKTLNNPNHNFIRAIAYSLNDINIDPLFSTDYRKYQPTPRLKLSLGQRRTPFPHAVEDFFADQKDTIANNITEILKYLLDD